MKEFSKITLGDVCEQVVDFRGRTPKKLGLSWGGGGIPALSANNVQMGTIDFTKECYLGSEQLYRRWMTKGDCRKGDIIFTTEAPLGNVAQIPDNNKYILSQRVILLRPDQSKANECYLAQYMRSSLFQRALLSKASGSTAKGIQQKQLVKIAIYLPSVDQQRAIATMLFAWDKAFGVLIKLIQAKRQFKKGLAQKLLTGRKRLSNFSGKWNIKELTEIADIKDGTHQTPKYVGSGIPFYSVEHITSNNFTDTKFISKEEHKFLTKNFKIERNDILMTRIGSIGDCKLIDWDVNASFYVSLALLKIKNNISPQFIAHYSKTDEFKRQIEARALQWAVPKKINLGEISKIKICIPPTMEEQAAIARILTAADKEIVILEKTLSALKIQKQGIMQKLLTGKIRVKV